MSTPLPPPEPRTSLMPVILGFALAGVTLLVLGFWVANRKPADDTPRLVLIEPARDTVAATPLRLRFSTDRDLTLQPTGWGAGRYHVHALVGTVELMPGPRDIRPVGPRTYEWTIPPIQDSATVQLVWSLPSHARLPGGASAARRVSAR